MGFFDPAIEVIDPELPGGEPIRGREALALALAPMLDSWETIAVKDYEFITVGDRVLAMTHVSGHGTGTRGEMEVEFRDAHIMTFKDGLVVRWRLYQDRAEALADAGFDPELGGRET